MTRRLFYPPVLGRAVLLATSALSLTSCSIAGDEPSPRTACISVRAGGDDVPGYGHPLSVMLDGMEKNGFSLSWEKTPTGRILRAKKVDALTGKEESASFELIEKAAVHPSSACGPMEVLFTRYVNAEGVELDEFLLQSVVLTAVKSYAAEQGLAGPTFASTPATSVPSPAAVESDPPTATDFSPDEERLIAQANDAWAAYRNGDDSAEARQTELLDRLFQKGLCWGQEGEVQADYQFHRCTARSLQMQEQSSGTP